MTQELRKLAEAAPRFKEWYVLPAREPIDGTHSHCIAMEGYGVLGYWKGHKSAHTDADWLLKKEDAEFIAAANPAAILELLDRLEKAEKDAAVAIGMLADWCVAVDQNGTGWDDWDEHYKDAMYRPCPIREQLDEAIKVSREERQ